MKKTFGLNKLFKHKSVLVSPITSDLPVTEGLIMHLDASNSSSYSGSGTTITDLSGTGNNGSIYGNMTHDGSNFVFNGNGGFSHPNVMQNECTYSFWAYNTNPNKNYGQYFRQRTNPLSNTGQSDGNFMVIQGPAYGAAQYGKVSMRLYTSAGFSDIGYSSPTIGFNVWKNLTVSWSNTTKQLKYYHNGQLVETQTIVGNILLPVGTQYFGTAVDPGGGDVNYDGKINMFAAYNRVLTDAEVLQNFNALRGRFNI